MCGTCGCSDQDGGVVIRRPGKQSGDPLHRHSHDHHHSHLHGHDHDHQHDDYFHGHDHHFHSHAGHSHDHVHHSHNHDSISPDHQGRSNDHHTHDHDQHSHSHDHDHNAHSQVNTREIRLERDILDHNNLLAERNRGYLEAKNIFSLNVMSSPGAGKTTFLEKTINALKQELDIFVIEGDQQSMNDAEIIEKTGIPVIQINTGSGCHLDAGMINRAMKQLEVASNAVLFIENVGNLVCPALFDLGESCRVVLISVTEGDDKPVKYPNMFQKADICIINKTDLLPYVTFDVEKTKEYARRVNPDVQFIEVSATTGEGMEAWYEWLKSQKTRVRT